MSTGNIIRKFRGHDAYINAVRRPASPPAVLPACLPGLCPVIWPMLKTLQSPLAGTDTYRPGGPLLPRPPAVMQLCFSPNNDLLVSGGYDQAVKVWDCRSRSIDAIQVLKGFRDSVTSVATTER